MIAKLGLPAGNVVQNIRTILELTFYIFRDQKSFIDLNGWSK